MTPQERQLIDDLFDRLAKLENAPRDSEAMSAIMQGLRSAPNAVYALVQTALVQDEALKRAHDRIQELEAAVGQQQPAQQQGGFLDSMRDAIFGQGQGQPHGSVPPVRAPDIGGSRPVWNSGQAIQQAGGGYGQPPQQYNQPQYGQPYGGPQPPAFGGGAPGAPGDCAVARTSRRRRVKPVAAPSSLRVVESGARSSDWRTSAAKRIDHLHRAGLGAVIVCENWCAPSGRVARRARQTARAPAAGALAA